MSTSQKLRFILFGIIFPISLVLGTMLPLAAQGPTPTPVPLRWSVPRRMPGIADDANPPYLVADSNQTIHAFTSQWVDSELAIFYSRWTPNTNWSRPIDILLSPSAHQATVIGAFLDNKGMMHVAFFGGNAQGANIYYANAPLENVAQAGAWSQPTLVGAHAISPVAGMLTGDANGNLFILYSGSLDGSGLYLVRSTDSGATWSQPETIYLTGSNSLWVAPVQGAWDAQGQLHLLWTVVNKAGNGAAVYYARLEQDHQRWSRPFPLQTTKGNDYEADWGAIVAYNNELFAMYNYGFPTQRWVRRSSDGGRTWSAPVAPFESKGEYGHPVFLIDSSNTLRVVLGNRTMDESLHGAWFSTWRGDHWDALSPIISGPRTPDFDPSKPSAIVEQGNVLLVTWRNDPGPENNSVGVWYSFVTTDAAETPIQLPPTVAPTSIVASITPTEFVPTATPTPQAVLTNPAETTATPVSSPTDPTMTLIFAIVPVLLLVLGVVAVNTVLRR